MEPTTTQPTAYILCYTTVRQKPMATSSHTASKEELPTREVHEDHFEVFAEYDEMERNPLQQAQNRLGELRAMYEDEDSTIELYTWNICKVAETSEHYTTEANQVNTTIYPPEQVPEQWDNIEIEAIKEDKEHGCSRTFGEGVADFHSVYLHDVNGGAMCIADCETEAQAVEVAETLKRMVLHYKDNGHLE